LFALTIFLVRCFYNEELQPSQINHSEELQDLEILPEGHRRIPEGFFEFQHTGVSILRTVNPTSTIKSEFNPEREQILRDFEEQFGYKKESEIPRKSDEPKHNDRVIHQTSSYYYSDKEEVKPAAKSDSVEENWWDNHWPL